MTTDHGNSSSDAFLGRHPHAERPSWRPATTIDEYVENCRDGLETYSDRSATTLLGWSRTTLWRAKLAGTIPDELFERLKDAKPKPSMRDLASIAQTLKDEVDCKDANPECCSHRIGVLRLRRRTSADLCEIVHEFITAKSDDMP